jgi:TonB family protein
MNVGRLVAVWAGLGCGLMASGQTGLTQQEVEAKLQSAPFLIIRGMYGGDRLNFDAQGNLIGIADVLPFSLSALVGQQIHSSDTQIEIVGSRAGLEMKPNRDTRGPETVSGISREKGKHGKVTITLALDPQHPELLVAALDKMLSAGLNDGLLDALPDYWRPWLRHQLHPDESQSQTLGAASISLDGKLAPGVTPPTLIYNPNPTFSPDARQKKFSGICVVGIVVDRGGYVQSAWIVRALGMGLDERAVETVKQYKFKPAAYNGQPVPVEIEMEVNFRIY